MNVSVPRLGFRMLSNHVAFYKLVISLDIKVGIFNLWISMWQSDYDVLCIDSLQWDSCFRKEWNISLFLVHTGKRTIFVPPELQMLCSFELIAPGVPSRHTMQASRTMKHQPKPQPNLSTKHPEEKTLWRICPSVPQCDVLCVSGQFNKPSYQENGFKYNKVSPL